MTTILASYKDSTAYEADDRGYFRFLIVDETKETEICFRNCPANEANTLQFEIKELPLYEKNARPAFYEFAIPRPFADLFIQKLQQEYLPQNEYDEVQFTPSKNRVESIPQYSNGDELADQDFEIGGEG
ncbi:MAG TPA: hypothetical protein VEV83_11005 [Parafilimonas sp.]|nr:hypothetical protein [Parafilimonas sp.]